MSESPTALRKVELYFRELKRRNKLIAYYCVRLVRSPQTFVFQGRTYRYFWHRYNSTWRNERAVEVPIVRDIVQRVPAEKILEVGNVLSHYGPVTHNVVDKYEKAIGVINADICTYAPGRKYGLIVSISTLEHVGWDEPTRDPAKVLKAFENLSRLAAPGGRIVVTLPLFYNHLMDQSIQEGRISFSRRFYLKRVSTANEWREVNENQVGDAPYDNWTPAANALLIGYIDVV